MDHLLDPRGFTSATSRNRKRLLRNGSGHPDLAGGVRRISSLKFFLTIWNYSHAVEFADMWWEAFGM